MKVVILYLFGIIKIMIVVLDNWSLFCDYSYNYGYDWVYVIGFLLDFGYFY